MVTKIEKRHFDLSPLKPGQKYHIIFNRQGWADLGAKRTNPNDAIKEAIDYERLMLALHYKGFVEIIPAKNIVEVREIIKNRGKKDFIVTGTKYEDRTEMRGLGLRWDRDQKAWRGKLTPKDAEKLKKRFTVETDEEFTKSRQREQLREKRLAKAEKYEEWAEKQEQKKKELFDEHDKLLSVIPPGQPILVGHHSEKRHRKHLEHIDNLGKKGLEAMKQAESHKRKAATLKHLASQKLTAKERREKEYETLREKVKPGMQVYSLFHRQAGNVVKVFKKSVRVKLSFPEPVLIDLRHLKFKE
jgi:hypothetical protein